MIFINVNTVLHQHYEKAHAASVLSIITNINYLYEPKTI